MVRNFRWQYAAVVYLARQLIQFLRNTLIKTMSEIQKFHTDAMSIAASAAYAMLGDTKKNFQTAYKYSQELMLKLESEAAKTILTLEDMLMLTKTFSQAGLVPQTDKDIKNISTIGTAIKTLTEGMSNAGTQMRQELYSVILGKTKSR